MVRYTMRSSKNPPPPREGMAAKFVEGSVERRAAFEAQAALQRTSPRRQKRQKSPVSTSLGAASTRNNRNGTPSQAVTESQSLLSPDSQESTGISLSSANNVNVESQITVDTGFPSDKSDSDENYSVSSGDRATATATVVNNGAVVDVRAVVNDGADHNAGAVLNDSTVANAMGGELVGANNNEDDVDFDLLAAELENGDGELNEYSSDQFSLNERRHYFMDRAPISSQNRAAVEFVYMVEAETLTRDSGTRGLGDVKKLLHSKYIELIRQIPSNQFGEFGLRESMTERYYGAKKGGASGFYTKVLDTKKKVQAVTRKLSGIGTPLSHIPSGRGLTDVKQQFILQDYKAVMGPVSLLSMY